MQIFQPLFLFSIVGMLLLGVGCESAENRTVTPPSADTGSVVLTTNPTPDPAAPPQRAVLVGVYTCLPHRATTGPQTMECALGLQTEGEKYYALDFRLLQMEMLGVLQTGERIQVEGLLVPIEQISSDQWQKYSIQGIMSVTGLVKL